MTLIQWGLCGSGVALVFHLVAFCASCVGPRSTGRWGAETNVVYAVLGFGAGVLAGYLWTLGV